MFDADDTAENIIASGVKDSTLTAYFKANEEEKKNAEENPNNAVTTAHSLLYQEFPTKWVWVKKNKKMESASEGPASSWSDVFCSSCCWGLKHFLRMPIPNYGLWEGLEGNQLICEQHAFDAEEQQQMAAENIAKMNGEQAEAFNTIKTAIYENNPQMFFLHGPAGTGKTFTYKTLCYALHGDKKIVLRVASSGIAALLLPNGRTAHSTFKIPIEMFEGKGCSVKKILIWANCCMRPVLLFGMKCQCKIASAKRLWT